MRRAGLSTLLVALATTIGAPAECRAQRVTDAAVGARVATGGAPVAPISRSSAFADTTRADSATHRPIGPYLLIGAAAGAVIGAVLAASFHDSFCGEPAPGYSRTSTGSVEGAVIGAGLGLIVIASQLYGVGPTDPVTFVAMPAFLVAVALLATLVPALRATRVDPVVALKSD